jgi:hypothetical protein
VELVIDTDFIIKMGRYDLLGAFQDLMVAHGHVQPYRYLGEIRAALDQSRMDPIHSKFKSQVAWNVANSFVSSGSRLAPAQDIAVLDELDDITGVDQGEALLTEYAMRAPEAAIVTADKKFVDAMARPEAKKFRLALKDRIIHLEHIVFGLGTAKAPPWAEIRASIWAVPSCDVALDSLLDKGKEEPQAVADLFASTKNLNSRGVGTLPAPLCPPFLRPAKPPTAPPAAP